MRRLNWALWGGLLLAVLAFFSYFLLFAMIPVTRDVPWVSFLLFLGAAVLLVMGWRRAPRKIVASIVALLGFFLIGAFAFIITSTKNLPGSGNAPRVGQQAPAFALPDTQNRTLSLADALEGSNGVVLIFYRGFWWPFCNSELRSIQQNLPEFERLGVKPIAISVDTPTQSADLARKVGYTFPILSDRDAAVIRQYDVLHAGAGQGGGDVARPAEFLIDRNGTVRWRNLTEDYRVRARVEQILAEARKLR